MNLKWPVNAQPVYSSLAADGNGNFPHPLGARGEDRIGRTYRYCLAGGTSLVVGNAIQAPAQIADNQDMTPSAAAIGDLSISVTPGGTAVAAANLYKDGLAVIDTTPGIGYSYPIKSHLGFTAPTAFVVNLERDTAIVVALTGTSRVSVYSNPYRNVVAGPTTLTNIPVGVCQYIITNAEAGWLGTGGPFGTLIQGTPGVGLGVGCPGSAVGSVALHAVATIALVGNMMNSGTDGKVEAVRWILH